LISAFTISPVPSSIGLWPIAQYNAFRGKASYKKREV
jgi:hypothetical protein